MTVDNDWPEEAPDGKREDSIPPLFPTDPGVCIGKGGGGGGMGGYIKKGGRFMMNTLSISIKAVFLSRL